jgi:kynureninase
MITREDCVARDAADPLGRLRARFHLPPGVVYLDGNSLGPLPVSVPERVRAVVHEEWGTGLVRSWNDAGWWDAPRRAGDRIARLVGAHPGEVVVCDSTSVNLYKLLTAALRLRSDRKIVLTETGNFPTDLYIAGSAAAQHGAEVRAVDTGELHGALDGSVAVLLLTHVNYRTGEMHDLPELSASAHRAGALVLWDLAHSTGAVPVDLNGAGADLAVGCGYKYLNGGPGAPAFLFVASRWHDALDQPLTGWHGHAHPFAMAPRYEPAPGISRTLTGTPPILSLAALDAALDVFDEVTMADLRAKSVALCELLVALADERVPDVRVVSPRAAERRGSQVCLAHPEAHAIIQALVARGVIGDYREPEILRFGLAPLFVGFADVWDAVDHLVAVLATGEWSRPEFRRRSTVT